MLTSIIHLPETGFMPNFSLPQSLPKAVCLSETVFLPIYQPLPLHPHFTSFTDKNILPESADTLEADVLCDTCSWAEIEFCHAELGDSRRRQRLIQLAQQRGIAPNASIPQSCGSHAATKAAYRFYDNDSIKPEAILFPR